VQPPALPTPNTGPFREIVEALAGSPKAHVVREAVDDAFASSILPRRTKLLMMAVVGVLLPFLPIALLALALWWLARRRGAANAPAP